MPPPPGPGEDLNRNFHYRLSDQDDDGSNPPVAQILGAVSLAQPSLRAGVGFDAFDFFADLGQDERMARGGNGIAGPGGAASARETGQTFGIPPREAPRSALFLIGTPEQCVEKLNRRAAEWSMGQFIFAAGNAETTRRLAEEVLRYVER